MNTLIYTGQAKALVQGIGMNTRIGKIAKNLQEMKENQTVFQKEISKFSKKVFWMIFGITILVGVVGALKYPLYQAILTAISLAVAAIPEGLPAVVTLTLAMGAKILMKKHALVRRLGITESIGAVNIICTDKTGTLTENKMSVVGFFFNDKKISVEKVESKEFKQIILSSYLCNNAKAIEEKGKINYLGEPTEIALKEFADKFKFKELEYYKRINEISFTSKRKLMSVVENYKDRNFVYSKGAPEILIEKCNKIYYNGKYWKLTNTKKRELLKKNEEFSSKGYRVLGLAFKETKTPKRNIEKELVWLGLVIMMDPPRKHVKEAIKEVRDAGIRVIMMTGDNPLTAKAIADKIGLETNGIVLGREVDKLNDKQLEEKLNEGINIFARISPLHKLKILEILEKNNTVAMTGDGVNDALALKKADVGIAMGLNGTERSEEHTSELQSH